MVHDPVFILINSLFSMLIINGIFNKEFEYIPQSIGVGTALYIFGLYVYLYFVDKNTRYYCKNCKSVVSEVLTDITVGEYAQKPELKRVSQEPIPPKRYLKETIMILGAIGSVASIIVILIPR